MKKNKEVIIRSGKIKNGKRTHYLLNDVRVSKRTYDNYIKRRREIQEYHEEEARLNII